MRSPRDIARSLARSAIVLSAIVSLLSSSLLAAGAHQHPWSGAPEIVCAIDHEGQPESGAGVHDAERPHRHHCASCQLAAKSATQKPGLTAILERPGAASGAISAAVAVERTSRYVTAAPRGPPLS